MLKVAFVVQRCGLEVNGGAETLCLQVAQRMSRHWRTEVLTTCAHDYMSWANHYPVGAEDIGGVTVRRFAVDAPRDVGSFDLLSLKLQPRQRQCSLDEQEAWMRAQGPMSCGLLDFITSHSDEYDAFIFFTYLYATTYFLLPLVKEKAWLVPFAHDEWPIYFPMWERLFSLPRGLVFSTDEERDFLRQRFSNALPPGPVVGTGIDAVAVTNPVGFRQRHGLADPFLLYVGRVDGSKGCGELFDYFRRVREADPTPRKLVLIGREVMPIPQDKDIVRLGFVDEQTKWDAMAACDWLVMPSRYESLSLVLLETWAAGRPAIVNGECAVLTGHCRKANAGLWYSSFEEFQAILSVAKDADKHAMGRQGAAYVRANYTWKAVERKYLDLLEGRSPAAGLLP
ncbi:MAG: glycosyltransferase family 4 protein [Verrucomicrobia bacterium]|nr:glycosyltransferase family 4 protein [Verrucomicrobiota bacterium]